MARSRAFRSSGLLLLLLAAGPAASGEQPVFGGQLHAAGPGPVTMRLLADATPDSLEWSLPVMWIVGPRWHDFRRSGARDPLCSATPGGDSCTVFGIEDNTERLGKNLAQSPDPPWSNNAPGAAVASPPLAPGTPLVFAARMFDFAPGADLEFRSAEVATTAGFPGFLTMHDRVRQAAIFPGPGDTVRIGFTTSAEAPLSSNFLDYPIRIQVSNVGIRN